MYGVQISRCVAVRKNEFVAVKFEGKLNKVESMHAYWVPLKSAAVVDTAQYSFE